jgi:hypothetical protein
MGTMQLWPLTKKSSQQPKGAAKHSPVEGEPRTGNLVRGRFKRSVRHTRRLQKLAALSVGIIFITSVVSSFAAYAFRLQVEQDVNHLSQDTRSLDEMNRSLMVALNREQALMQISAKANQSLPFLRASQEVIDVPVSKTHLMAPISRKLVEPTTSMPGF